MAIFDNFWKAVVDGAKTLAKSKLKSGIEALTSDTKDFLNSSETKLQLWTQDLARGNISKAEFANLVKSQTSLAKMHALMLLGIEKTKVQKIRDELIDLVIKTAFDTFLP